MKVRYRKGIANHPGPESCGGAREGAAEALTGEPAGQPLSREISTSGAPTPLCCAEGNTAGRAMRESPSGLRAVVDPEHAGKLLAQELGDLVGARCADGDGRVGEGQRPQARHHADEKSDARIVPMNGRTTATLKPAAEGLEGRRAAKGNAEQPPAPRTQSRTGASMGLDGVREAAQSTGKEVRFTALHAPHHAELLSRSFYAI